jgi:hypothetical protein
LRGGAAFQHFARSNAVLQFFKADPLDPLSAETPDNTGNYIEIASNVSETIDHTACTNEVSRAWWAPCIQIQFTDY